MSHRGKTSKKKRSHPDGPDTGKKARMKSQEAALWQTAADLPQLRISTPEARTASDSLINQLREETKALEEKTTALQKETLALRKDKKALQEKTKALEEKTTALREDTKAFQEEKRTKPLDSLIHPNFGKSLHLSSEEEDRSDFSILEEIKALDSLICRSQEWSLTHLLSSKEEDLSALRLTEDQKMSEEEGSVSPSGSSDAQSDRSKGNNPNFSIEPRPSGSNSSAEDSGKKDDD